MDGRQRLNRLEFDTNSPFHEKVHAIATFELYAFVDDRQGFLPLENDISQVELMSKTLFICGLKEARSEHAMDLNSRSDD